jgi:hypothetical protein
MSEYRLGDIVKYNGTRMFGAADSAAAHPERIGGKYAKLTAKHSDFATLASVAREVCPPAGRETIVHLRLGDHLCGWYNQPSSADITAQTINELLPSAPKTLLYGNHNQSCAAESETYLNTLRAAIPNVEVSSNADPDDDFCRMVNAEVFVAGRGGFSDMAAQVRKIWGRETITHSLLSGYLLDGKWYHHDPIHADHMQIERS